MTRDEFELVRNSRRYLLKEIYKSYVKSINPVTIAHFKKTLDKYIKISELKKYDTIFGCLKYVIQENMTFFFINNLEELGYNVDEVLDELDVEKNRDYDRRENVIWSLNFTNSMLEDFYNVCEQIFTNVYIRKFPTDRKSVV